MRVYRPTKEGRPHWPGDGIVRREADARWWTPEQVCATRTDYADRYDREISKEQKAAVLDRVTRLLDAMVQAGLVDCFEENVEARFVEVHQHIARLTESGYVVVGFDTPPHFSMPEHFRGARRGGTYGGGLDEYSFTVTAKPKP